MLPGGLLWKERGTRGAALTPVPRQPPQPTPAALTCGPHGGLGHLEGAAPRAEAVPTVAAVPLWTRHVNVRWTHPQAPDTQYLLPPIIPSCTTQEGPQWSGNETGPNSQHRLVRVWA